MLEKDIENDVVQWARDRKFLTPKVRFVENGYPDRLFISPLGHTIFIEFKKPGKKPERIQFYRIEQLRLRHIPAYWADTYVEAINILKAALEPEELPEASHPPATVTSIGRSAAGPGIGEDVCCPGGDKDPPGDESNQGSSGCCPSSTDDPNVA